MSNACLTNDECIHWEVTLSSVEDLLHGVFGTKYMERALEPRLAQVCPLQVLATVTILMTASFSCVTFIVSHLPPSQGSLHKDKDLCLFSSQMNRR